VSIAPVSNPVFSQSYSDPAWTEDPLNKLFLEQAKMQQQFGYPGSPTAAHGEFQNLRIISKTLQRTAVQNAPLEKAVAETEQFMKEHLEQLYGE